MFISLISWFAPFLRPGVSHLVSRSTVDTYIYLVPGVSSPANKPPEFVWLMFLLQPDAQELPSVCTTGGQVGRSGFSAVKVSDTL